MSARAARGVVDRRRAARPTAAVRAVTSALRAETVRRLVARQVPVRLTIGGGSMAPVLRNGDRVVLGPLGERPMRGDLLVLGSGDDLVIRRFVERPSPGVIFTTGDDSSGRGVPLSEAAIVGVIETIERGGRIVACEPGGTLLSRLMSRVRGLAGRAALGRPGER